jgi:hypothetical protein
MSPAKRKFGGAPFIFAYLVSDSLSLLSLESLRSTQFADLCGDLEAGLMATRARLSHWGISGVAQVCWAAAVAFRCFRLR